MSLHESIPKTTTYRILADSRVYVLPIPSSIPERHGEVVRGGRDWSAIGQNWRVGAMPSSTLTTTAKKPVPRTARPVLSRLIISQPAPITKPNNHNMPIDTPVVRNYRASPSAWDSPRGSPDVPTSASSHDSDYNIVMEWTYEVNEPGWDWDLDWTEAEVAQDELEGNGLKRDRAIETRFPDPRQRFWYRALKKLKTLRNYPAKE